VPADQHTINDSDRVPAGILFGDMKGSTEEAELDEKSTIVKLREYERIINEIANRFGPNFYKVKTEGDGFMATFASAHIMVACGLAVQQEFCRRGWQVRLGGHYGEVFRNKQGDAFGADVNRAARIMSAADATSGEFLVSDAVQVIVRDRLPDAHFEPHEPILAKGVGSLVVFAAVATGQPSRPPVSPHVGAASAKPGRLPPPPPRRNRPRIGPAAAFTVLLMLAGLAGGVWYWRGMARKTLPQNIGDRSGKPTDVMRPIAVMEFENQRADDSKDDWYAKALQAAFNTELSKIPTLPVVAPELIQQVAKETSLDRMAAAKKLGVTRFVTGSFAVVGDSIRIDARIVQTTTGIQEAAENIEGRQDEFFALQKSLTLATLEHFRVRLTKSEAESFKQTTNSRLDKYKMLLDAEGVTKGKSGGEPETKASDAQAFGSAGREVIGTFAAARVWSWVLPAPAVALAQAPLEAAAREVLEEYRRAHERGDLDQLASLYVNFPAAQRQKIDAYLKGITDLHVELADVKIQPREHDIAVSYIRRDKFVDKETGEPVTLEVRLTKFLVQDGAKWKFAEGS
jgi:class 3 adenylate cyclase/TolB-like protein